MSPFLFPLVLILLASLNVNIINNWIDFRWIGVILFDYGCYSLSRTRPLQAVEETINFRFSNRSLLLQALRAAGVTNSDGNRRLASIGDAALKLVLVMEGYVWQMGNQRYEKSWWPRVRINRTKSLLSTSERINAIITTRSSNAHLATQGHLHGLDSCIRNNPSQSRFIGDGLMGMPSSVLFFFWTPRKSAVKDVAWPWASFGQSEPDVPIKHGIS